jgi:hexosaminidase
MEARYHRLAGRGAPHPDTFLLNDLEDQSRYRSAQLFRDNVINPGKPGVYAFIDMVVGQLAAMHRKAGAPLHTLHVGADELAVGAWERSPAAHAEMQRIGAKTTADLWDHFYDQVDAIAQRHGAHLAGWEELGVRKVIVKGRYEPSPNPHFNGRPFLLHVWNNLEGSEDLAYQLANAGYSVVLSPATNLYFDMAHSLDALEPGHNWAAYLELSDVFGFDPFNMNRASRTPGLQSLSPSARDRIAGLEGTLFSETMRDPQRLDYMMAPRLFALAERAWAKAPDWTETGDPLQATAQRVADWSAFSTLLGRHVLPMLDAARPDVAYRIPPPGLMVRDGHVLANHAYPGMTLRYTVGGAAPDASSRPVAGPIPEKGLITVTAFSRNGRAGRSASIENP